MQPSWGMLADGVASACLRHKGDIMGGPVINFKRKCSIAGCGKVSRWGVDGKQPTCCRDHGPREDGLVCTIEATGSKRVSRRPSDDAAQASFVDVKAQCSF